jgi:uncharacterized damage-inducible protein DinB
MREVGMKTYIERMLRAMSWADRRTLEAVRECPEAQADALPLLAHLLAAEHLWLARLRNQEATHPGWPQRTVIECERLAEQNASEYASFVKSQSENDLNAPVRYRTTNGEEFATPIIDILTHVVIHGAYHRGQIAKALGRNGVQAVNTDFITFARSVEPWSV